MDTNIITSNIYEKDFWNYAKGAASAHAIRDAFDGSTGMYPLPSGSSKKFEDEITKESVMRQICTIVDFKSTTGQLHTSEFDDKASFLAEGDDVPVTDIKDDFSKTSVGRHKMATILKASAEFVQDTAFDLEKYLAHRLGVTFARSEDDGFLNGSTNIEPKGLLSENGADTGVTTTDITYANILSLYFSIEAKYRKNAVWLMNDNTALALKNLKDDSGNPLWKDSDDTLLGHKVYISEYMPDIEAGEKPIAFGDFSYYWIIRRSVIKAKALSELFILNGQIGFSFVRFIDGLLINSSAVKVMEITEPEEDA